MHRQRIFNTAYGTAMWIFIGIAAVAARFLPGIIDILTSDLKIYVLNWVKWIHLCGASAYADAFTNYAPLYTYLLAPISLLPQELWPLGIKTLSILGDIALAGAVGGVVAQVSYGASQRFRLNIGLCAGAAVLWLPTVIINSAAWGQCDVLWTACCIFSLLFFLKDKPLAAMLWFGLAMSFKMQAIFFFPVVAMLLFAGKVKWWHLLAGAGVFVLTCVPCMAAGRPWFEVLRVYEMQARMGIDWYANVASPYIIFRNFDYYRPVAVVILAIEAALSVWLCLKIARSFRAMDAASRVRLLLILTAFCGVVYPYCLPTMHERYMYMGDIATLMAAFALWSNRRMWIAAACTELASILTVGGVLTGLDTIPGVLPAGVIFATIAVVLLSRELYLTLFPKTNND